jgi:hypothetical protein
MSLEKGENYNTKKDQRVNLLKRKDITVNIPLGEVEEEEYDLMVNVIKSMIPESARVNEYVVYNTNLLGNLLVEFDSYFDQEIIIFEVEGHYISNFCLTGFSIIPIIISRRSSEIFFLIQYGFEEAYQYDFEDGTYKVPVDPNGGEILNIIEVVSYLIICELFLVKGRYREAINTFLQRYRGNKNVIYSVPYSLHLTKVGYFTEPWIDSIYDNFIIYFNLIHEMGHIFEPKKSSTDLSSYIYSQLSDQLIIKILREILINEYFDSLNNDPEQQEILTRIISKSLTDKSSFILGIENLRQEFKSDLVAIEVIMKCLHKEVGENFHHEKIIEQCFNYFNGLNAILHAKYILFDSHEVNKNVEDEFLYNSVATSVRLSVIMIYFRNVLINRNLKPNTDQSNYVKIVEQSTMILNELSKRAEKRNVGFLKYFSWTCKNINSDEEIISKDYSYFIDKYGLKELNSSLDKILRFDLLQLTYISQGYGCPSETLNYINKNFSYH